MNAIDRYAVIGNPIAHSKSPQIHRRFAAGVGHQLSYEALLAPLDGFAATVAEFVRGGGRGANVTLPFKLEAHALATELSARARSAGAVNTLCFDGKRILGDNTDGVGMVGDIVRNAGVALQGRRILLLGAGGAARGVLLPLLEERPAQLVIANRTPARAEQLAQQFSVFSSHGADMRACAFDAIAGRFDVVINATSASLTRELPPIPAGAIDEGSFAYDMMYGAQATVFMQFAASRGAAVRDGLGMLVEQAAESFFLWRGVRPDTAAVYSELRAELRAGS